MAFQNRQDAAEQLIRTLREQHVSFDVVLALPRGGVPIGVEIAKAFDVPIDLIIPRKIRAPGNPEYAVGAVTEEGDVIWNEEAIQNIDREKLEKIVQTERGEAVRRRTTYLADRERLNIADRDVLIVDDGIATGLTMRAAILEARQQGPNRIIVAAPVAPPDTTDTLEKEVDKLVILKTPIMFMAIGQFYDSFDQVTDERVLELLKQV